jgi:hypothetical protein
MYEKKQPCLCIELLPLIVTGFFVSLRVWKCVALPSVSVVKAEPLCLCVFGGIQWGIDSTRNKGS